jgi:hypothetical protein
MHCINTFHICLIRLLSHTLVIVTALTGTTIEVSMGFPFSFTRCFKEMQYFFHDHQINLEDICNIGALTVNIEFAWRG